MVSFHGQTLCTAGSAPAGPRLKGSACSLLPRGLAEGLAEGLAKGLAALAACSPKPDQSRETARDMLAYSPARVRVLDDKFVINSLRCAQTAPL